MSVEDILGVWSRDPLFYPGKPAAHWLMVSEVVDAVLVVRIAPSVLEIPPGVDRSAATRHLRASPLAAGGTVMTTDPMTPDQEYDCYAERAGQKPQGQSRRRCKRRTIPIPVASRPTRSPRSRRAD